MRRALPYSHDELESAAFMALVEAAQTFDPSRNVDFSTFARHRIWGALCDVRREALFGKGKGGPHARVVNRTAEAAEAHGHVLGSEPDEPVGADLELHETVESWIRSLPRTHSQAFRHIYLDGKTQEEAASLVGCSKSYMSRLHNEALSWLHQTYGLDPSSS
jgi:RNA polymerase sigma factor (sigma-70 family)